MTKEQRKFLALLAPHSRPVTRRDFPLADREENSVHQSCKRAGWVVFDHGSRSSRYAPIGWRITDAGRAALNAAAGEMKP
jgi:hypothetical protein